MSFVWNLQARAYQLFFQMRKLRLRGLNTLTQFNPDSLGLNTPAQFNPDSFPFSAGPLVQRWALGAGEPGKGKQAAQSSGVHLTLW